MNMLMRPLVWLSRVTCCRGFGIQSPTDYRFVRYVVNKHWPYYAYSELPDDDWLTRKLGRLYFRLSNWRQPHTMLADKWQRYWQAGCRKTCFQPSLPDKVELARVDIDDEDGFDALLPLVDERSVIVVEGLWRNWHRWHTIVSNSRVGTTFDLYYCGILWFDKQRTSHHYKINF